MDYDKINYAALPNIIADSAKSSMEKFDFKDRIPYNRTVFNDFSVWMDADLVDFVTEESGAQQIPIDTEIYDFLDSCYRESFWIGYGEISRTLEIEPELTEDLTFQIFAEVYETSDRFEKTFLNKVGLPLVSQKGIRDYAFALGRYMRSWQEVVSKPHRFEHLFEKQSSSWSVETERRLTFQNGRNDTTEGKGIQFKLIELFTALCENGNFVESNKKVFEEVGRFLGVNLDNHHQAFEKIASRKKVSQTQFIDELKAALLRRANR